MEKSKIEIFTRPGCRFCPSALVLVKNVEKEREDVEVIEYNIWAEGKSKAEEFGINAVPTIFVSGPKHNEILAFRGEPSKARLIEAIDISLGIKKINEKGILSKVKGMFS